MIAIIYLIKRLYNSISKYIQLIKFLLNIIYLNRNLTNIFFQIIRFVLQKIIISKIFIIF